MRDSEHRQYSKEWIQHDRPQPMWDKTLNKVYDTVFKENPVHSNTLVDDFKQDFDTFLKSHTLSTFTGTDQFPIRDICIGCTHYIDDLYHRLGRDNLMIFENDYKYHWRLNNDIKYITIDTLDPNKELLISLPFPAVGDIHPDMMKILDRCNELNIPVHLDCAWLPCCRDISFNFDHPAIKTFAISLSKSGLGTDRIGIRFARVKPSGIISIMNDFDMNCKSLLHVGRAFMKICGPEYFWKTYEERYYKVCKDFDLKPTKAIHVAMSDTGIVGIRPLLRYQT